MTLTKDLSTTSVIIILPKGELVLRNINIAFEGSYLHPDLFLYYNWAILSSFPQAEVRNYTHEQIILHIPYICNITSTEFDVFLIIGNQSSNSYELNFGPPRVTGIESGSIVLEFYVNYFNSKFYFRIPISVERPPVFELLSPHVVSTSANSLVFIHSYSYFDLEPSFHLMILLLNLLTLSSSPVLIPSLFTDLN
ncbi:hypothetical protein GEMRC1_009335 [Eukaryota sp. GEM-RC1]